MGKKNESRINPLLNDRVCPDCGGRMVFSTYTGGEGWFT